MLLLLCCPYEALTARVSFGSVEGRHYIRITGATGLYAIGINGLYKPTNEMCGNATVYVKEWHDDMCSEYFAPLKQWQVKLAANKGKDRCYSCCAVPTKRLPQECPLGQWYAWDGSKFVPQSAIKVRRNS